MSKSRKTAPVAPAPAREITDAEKLSYVIAKVERDIAHAQSEIDKFVADVAADSFSAFEWSRTAMSAAADKSVLRAILGILRDRGLAAAKEFATEQALHGARYPSMSTSPTSNLMATYKTAAWATFVEAARWA